jgi:hypothetical protein
MRIRKAPSKKQQLIALTMHIADLQKQLLELRMAVAESKMRALVENIVTMRSKEIGTLTDHAVKALRLLIDAGVITQAQANEAIR